MRKRIPTILLAGLALASAPMRAEADPPKALRPTVRVHGIPDVMQVNNYSCGAAAVQGVAQRYGIWGYQDRWAAELGTTPEEGTHPANIVAVLRSYDLDAQLIEGMTLAELFAFMDEGHAVIVDFQAYGEPSYGDYSQKWEDGHYGIAVGYSDTHIFIEDPSLLGTVGVLTHEDFQDRWHDYENEGGRRRDYRHMAIVVNGTPAWPPRYSPIE